MTQDEIAALRPAADTVEAIDTALSRIAETKATKATREAHLREQRKSLLVTGSVEEIRRVEKALADITLELEQLETLAATMRERRLPILKDAERQALEARAVEFAEAKARLAERVRVRYPQLAGELADLLKEVDAHFLEGFQIDAEMRASLLNETERRHITALLGVGLRKLVVGRDDDAAYSNNCWLPELTYLPNLASDRGLFWYKRGFRDRRLF